MITQEMYRETKWVLNILQNRYNKNKMKFDNPIQRPFLWQYSRSSSYIYNIFNGIAAFAAPILASKKKIDGVLVYDIIDGQQRVLSVCKYMNGDFPLKGLNDKPPITIDDVSFNLNGKYFKQLPEEFKEYMMNYALNFIELTNATPDDEREFFISLNSGIAMRSVDLSRSKNPNIEKLNAFRSHELFTCMFSSKTLAHNPQDDVIVKSWIVLNETTPNFTQLHYNEVAATLDLSDENIEEINNVFDFVYESYKHVQIKNKAIARKYINKTHFWMYIPYVFNFKNAKQFSEWVLMFFENVPEEYTQAAAGGTASSSSISVRRKIVEESITKFLDEH